MTEVKWTRVTITGPIEADIYKGLLESNDIPVFLRSDATQTVHPFNVGMLGDVDVMVPEDKVEVARRLMEDVDIEDIPEQDQIEE